MDIVMKNLHQKADGEQPKIKDVTLDSDKYNLDVFMTEGNFSFCNIRCVFNLLFL